MELIHIKLGTNIKNEIILNIAFAYESKMFSDFLEIFAEVLLVNYISLIFFNLIYSFILLQILKNLIL